MAPLARGRPSVKARSWRWQEAQAKSPVAVMFQGAYMRRLIEVGERDAESRLDEIRELVAPTSGNRDSV